VSTETQTPPNAPAQLRDVRKLSRADYRTAKAEAFRDLRRREIETREQRVMAEVASEKDDRAKALILRKYGHR